MPELTMTAKGQITINKKLRDGLGVRPGQKFHVDVRPDGGLVIPPVKDRRKTLTWDDVAGSIVPPPERRGATIEQMNETIAKGWAGLLEDND